MKVNSVSSFTSSEPHYSQPVSPPRPVTQDKVELMESLPIISRQSSTASVSKTVPLTPTKMIEVCDKPRVAPVVTQIKQMSPILKPARPVSPKLCFSSSSSCSSDESPPPRPKSPEYHPPAVRHQGQMRNMSRGHISETSSSGDSCDLGNLADLVSARLAAGVRHSAAPAPGHSRPFTPSSQETSRPQSRSRFLHSGSTTPQLSKQNSFVNTHAMLPQNTRNFDNNFTNRYLHTSDFLDDSDYGAYQISRDFMRTPSVLDDRSFSRAESTSYFDDNDYSAFTPDLRLQRKMSFSSSVCSTPLQTPKLNRDFGFVSSKKDAMPKPPRRRSKEHNSSRPVSRQHRSSSRETTPVNNPVKSPVRPSRLRASKNYPAAPQHKSETNKVNRPRSLQEPSQEPIYEILSPVVSKTINNNRSNKMQRNRISYSSSSDSETEFKTPLASPRFVRHPNKNKKSNRGSDIYEDIEVGSQSYQNIRDNPIVQKKTKQAVSQVSRTEAKEQSAVKLKMIPPRTSQDPIPTPRKSSLSRSRDQSVESLHSLNSLPRKLYPKIKEPHYKVPPPNPRPVFPNDSHFYSELLYEDNHDHKENNTNNIKDIDSNNKHSLDEIKHRITSENGQNPVNQSGNDKMLVKSVDRKQKQQKNETPQHQHKQNIIRRNSDLLESNKSVVGPDTDVKVELTGEEDRFYDAQEDAVEFMVKKSKAIATLPDGSKYPCVIVQKKSKSDSLRKDGNDKKTEAEIVPKKAPRTFKNYTPVDMKMKPDWFEDLKIKDKTAEPPQPTSIIDGVLYTSRALLDQERDNISKRKLNTFNLIKPEVFETYDVCKNISKKPESKVQYSYMKATKNILYFVANTCLSSII